MKKKILSLLLSLVMVVAMMPAMTVMSFAVEDQTLVASTRKLVGSYFLSSDVETSVSDYIYTGSDSVIDLQGHTLNLEGKYIWVYQHQLVIKDTVGGGKIIGGEGKISSGKSYGGAVYLASAGELQLESGIIEGNSASSGAGVYVSQDCDFIMNGGSIKNNIADSGGGVYLGTGATFTMNDGTINGNTASNYGGAVYNTNILNIYGGTIGGANDADKNTAVYGGGIFNSSSGTLNMYGGNISANIATTGGGGVANKNIFNMTGGTIGGIKANKAPYGGGVYADTGTVELSGNSTIKGNEATNNGGGVYNKAILYISNNAKIISNSGKKGAGIYSSNSGSNSSLTMKGGTIKCNDATSQGGGIYNGTNDVTTITGGLLSGNMAPNGGAVCCNNTFVMIGGRINNNGSSSTGCGAGVYNNGELTLGKSANITGNVKNGTITSSGDGYIYTGGSPDNVYLPSDKDITVGSNENAPIVLGDNKMNVGVSMQTARVFTSNEADGFVSTFFADKFTSYKVIYNSDKRLRLALKYNVSIDTGITNGTVTTDATSGQAFESDIVTVIVVPDNGYELNTLTVRDASGNSVFVSNKKFTMPDKTVTITATFKQKITPIWINPKIPDEKAADEKITELVEESKVAVGKTTAYKNGKIKVEFKALTLKDGTKVTKYQVGRSTSKKFTKKLKKYNATCKKSSNTVSFTNAKGLKKGTRYYYKIRGKVQLSDGSWVYTKWSKVKSIKCKKTRK